MPGLPARRLLRRFRAGDHDAVRELYRRYAGPVFSVALSTLGDRGLAEEAVQQTFLQAWRASGRFDIDEDPAPWLYAIARRVAIDLYRRERRHTSVDLDHEVAVVPDGIENAWEIWELRRALDNLPADEQKLVRAVHLSGLTHAEASEVFKIPVGTVKSRLHRAHRRLAGMLAHVREESA